jgi:hypothetical protein
MLLAIALIFLLALPVQAEPIKGSVGWNELNCDWYVWDDDSHLWGWATVYSHDGKICRGKYWMAPNPMQYARAVRDGIDTTAPSNTHPTDLSEIAKVGGIKPLPADGFILPQDVEKYESSR